MSIYGPKGYLLSSLFFFSLWNSLYADCICHCLQHQEILSWPLFASDSPAVRSHCQCRHYSCARSGTYPIVQYVAAVITVYSRGIPSKIQLEISTARVACTCNVLAAWQRTYGCWQRVSSHAVTATVVRISTDLALAAVMIRSVILLQDQSRVAECKSLLAITLVVLAVYFPGAYTAAHNFTCRFHDCSGWHQTVPAR